MRNTLLFALLLWMYVVPLAHSQDQTSLVESGNGFLSKCEDMTDKSSPATFEQGVCYGYVMGVTGGFRLVYELEGRNPPFCTPEEATNRQVASILIKYIKGHPERAHLETRTLEIESLIVAFPCKTEPKKK